MFKEHGSEFPRQESYYNFVLDLLDEMLQLIQPYITQGLEGEELVTEYFLNAAGNLVDVINSDLGNMSPTSLTDVYNVSRVIERRVMIERSVQMIDRTMIIIFQVSASLR